MNSCSSETSEISEETTTTTTSSYYTEEKEITEITSILISPTENYEIETTTSVEIIPEITTFEEIVTTTQTQTIPYSENYHGHVYTGGEKSKKYHYEEHCPGKNSHEITWDEVSERNLGPCGTCVLK